MSLNSHMYYILGRMFFVKHMIVKKGKFSHTLSALYPPVWKQETSSRKWAIDQTWPLDMFRLVDPLSQHLKLRRLMQKSAVEASPRTKSGPLEPILLFGLHVEASPSIWGRYSWVCLPQLAFALSQFTSVSSISI